MKTDKQSEMAKRYQMAEQQVWAKLENWQKLAITQDRKENKFSSQFESFSKQVIELAESKEFSSKKSLTSTQK